MFRSRGESLLFDLRRERCVHLHTWFVFFPLDIYYLDSQGKVLYALQRVRPFRFFIRGVRAQYILETSQETSYKVGEKVFKGTV